VEKAVLYSGENDSETVSFILISLTVEFLKVYEKHNLKKPKIVCR